jgi:6-phosphogluconolactonase (cycloisomerase 2 family)
MRTLSFPAVFCIVSMTFLAGCGANTHPNSPTQSSPLYTADAKYAYVGTQSFIDEYSVSTAGQWTEIGHAIPIQGATTGTAIAIDPKYRFLYFVAGSSANSVISMYTITSGTGVLVPTSPASITIAGTLSQGIAVDGLGKFVYTADTDSSTVTSLAINQTTGVLTPTSVSSIRAGVNTSGVTTDALGKYVFASDEYGDISEFTINQTTGNLSANSPGSLQGGGRAGTISPAETFFYSPGQAPGDVVVLSLNSATGVLSEIQSGAVPAGNDPVSIALTPNGNFAYVADRSDGELLTFSVNATTGLLASLGSSVPPGAAEPTNIVIDPGGQLAYVSCQGGNLVTIFSISTTGTLAQIGSVSTDLVPQAVVVVPR